MVRFGRRMVGVVQQQQYYYYYGGNRGRVVRGVHNHGWGSVFRFRAEGRTTTKGDTMAGSWWWSGDEEMRIRTRSEGLNRGSVEVGSVEVGETVTRWTSAGPELPESLADERLYTELESGRLTFAAVCEAGFGGSDELSERLEALFPGCAVATVALAPGERVHGAPSNGVSVVCWKDADRNAAVRAVSWLAPHAFRANSTLAKNHFVAREATGREKKRIARELDSTIDVLTSYDIADAAIFNLPQVVVFPGRTLFLKVFESRYKHMLKDCLDEHRPFLLGPSRAGAVCAICRPVAVQYLTDTGEAGVVVQCVGRAVLRCDASESRAEFGLQRASAPEILLDDASTDPEQDTRLLFGLDTHLKDCVHELFHLLRTAPFGLTSGFAEVRASLDAVGLDPPDPDAPLKEWTRFTWTLADWIAPLAQPQHKQAWLAHVSPLDRFRDILAHLDAVLAHFRAQRETGGSFSGGAFSSPVAPPTTTLSTPPPESSENCPNQTTRTSKAQVVTTPEDPPPTSSPSSPAPTPTPTTGGAGVESSTSSSPVPPTDE